MFKVFSKLVRCKEHWEKVTTRYCGVEWVKHKVSITSTTSLYLYLGPVIIVFFTVTRLTSQNVCRGEVRVGYARVGWGREGSMA